jgi:hypothetical protein
MYKGKNPYSQASTRGLCVTYHLQRRWGDLLRLVHNSSKLLATSPGSEYSHTLTQYPMPYIHVWDHQDTHAKILTEEFFITTLNGNIQSIYPLKMDKSYGVFLLWNINDNKNK